MALAAHRGSGEISESGGSGRRAWRQRKWQMAA